MIQSIVLFVNQLLTFYIPTFYTFKFLMNNNAPKIRSVLKFWSVLTIYHLLQWVLSHIIAEKLFPIIDLIVLVTLNWKQMEYAELAFDSVIAPTFRNNRETIDKFTSVLQELFNKKTAKLKEKVTDSTSEKLKGFIGEILVGALNPNLKRQTSSESERQSTRNEDGEEQENDEEKEE